VNVEAAARAWAETWRTAWPAKDEDAIVALYSDDAVYLSHPFREPHLRSAGVRDYVRGALAEEEDVECWFGDPVVSGNRAAVEYWAVLRESGEEMTLAGTTVLRFADDGRVDVHRDYWAMQEGRRLPPDGWGR
jgi:ketosteroid isomerase-like protein